MGKGILVQILILKKAYSPRVIAPLGIGGEERREREGFGGR
jgi:hypothetical protein